jgi:tetratricopeptide (TPR) repeat protein
LLTAALPMLAADSPAAFEADFDQANRLYEQGKFAEAAAAYEKMLQSGQASAALYFNLGNALFKSGQTGRAILNYRRADQLAPRDPDIRANLLFARKSVGSGDGQPAIWRRWINRLTLNEWTAIAAGAFWLWFGLLTLGQMRSGFRVSLRGYTATAGMMTGLLGVCLALTFHDRIHTRWAVVVTPEAVVRHGPLEESPRHYTARDGTELTVTDRQNDWIEVLDSSGRKGWLRRDQVLSLPTPGNHQS